MFCATNANWNSVCNEVIPEHFSNKVPGNVVIMEKCQIIFVGENDYNSEVFQCERVLNIVSKNCCGQFTYCQKEFIIALMEDIVIC